MFVVWKGTSLSPALREVSLWVVEVFMRTWSEIDEGNVSMLRMSSELLNPCSVCWEVVLLN